MTKRTKRGRHILFAVAMLMTASVVTLAVFRRLRQEPKPQRRATTFKAERVNVAPHVSSKVKSLEVTGVRILKQGTPEATLTIDVVNNSDHPVMSLEITSGDDHDFSALGIDGLADPAKPEVQIQPHSLRTFEWNLAAVLEGYPIRLAAAVFDDGKAEGEARYIEMIHKGQEQSKARREAAEKGSPQ